MFIFHVDNFDGGALKIVCSVGFSSCPVYKWFKHLSLVIKEILCDALNK